MKVRTLVECSLFTTLMVISAQISISIGLVPFTLQTLVIPLVALVVGSRKSVISVLIYLLLGLIGLPVFANFNAGLSALLGPTGGFILSFIFMAYIIGKTSDKTNNVYYISLAVIVANIVNLGLGVAYFMLVTNISLTKSLAVAVYPFLISTVIKMIFTVLIGIKLKKIYRLRTHR